jgi:hypothetical protein
MSSILRIAPVGPAVAKLACQKWHYSRTVAAVAIARFGVWERGRFIGVVIFGTGACPRIGGPFGLGSGLICELIRVTLDRHETPVSRIIAIALRLLRRSRPALRLVVSFADQGRGHAGGIYKAGNWIYIGTTKGDYRLLCPDGVIRHARSANDLYPTTRGFTRIKELPKHKYLYPFDDAIRHAVAPLSKPYPRVASIDGDAPDNIQSGQGGSNPTATLDPPPEAT